MNDTISGNIGSAVNKGVGLVKGFGRRLLVHIGALTAGGIVGSVAGAGTPMEKGGVFFLTYVGLICLFPRGEVKTPAWYLPTIIGALQCLVLIVLGLPWPLVFFWGGLQTWLQRLLQYKGDLGWEWVTAPVLALCTFGFFSDASTAGLSLFPLWSVPVVAVLGWCIRVAYMRLKMEPIHRTMLAVAAKRLQSLAAERALPQELHKPLELLSAQSGSYGKAAATLGPEGCGLAQRVDRLARELAAFSRRPNPLEETQKTRQMLGDIGELNGLLQQKLRDLPLDAFDAQMKLPDDIAGRMEAYEDSARQLRLKQPKLPQNLGTHVEGISAAAYNILQCMRDDPQDRSPGDRFLNRYLKSAHMIVDEYLRLSGENAAHKDIAAALTRSGDLLGRLEEAFKQEHAALLQNDAVNYTAELDTLDALLKMKGR